MNTHRSKHTLNTTGVVYKHPQEAITDRQGWGNLLLDIPIPVGKKAKTVRERQGKSQQQVADVLGVDAASVSAFERGVVWLSLPHFAKLCVYLEVSADNLLSL